MKIAALALLLAAGPALAQAPPERRNFIACPMVRDTEEVPCWVARYKGELYFLGIQEDISGPFHPPQLKHKALVEGTVSDAPRVCGGIVLKPVTVSVLPELDPACDTILPAEGYRIDNAPRPPGPANRGKGLATDPATPAGPPPKPSPANEGPKTFTVRFGFDGDYINVHQFQAVLQAAAYAKATGGKVEVTGRRAAVLLSDGALATEGERMATRRADKVALALKQLGAPAATVSAPPEIEAADGRDDALRRRVEIRVTP